jgi:predicted nucleic acid-binding protein
MKFLVDANVLSEVTRPEPQPAVVQWLRKHERDIVVTPIVLGEIEYGIGLTTSIRKRKELKRWFAEGMRRLRVIDLDTDTASIWAALLVRLRKKGKAMPVKNSLIAASALQHQLTIVTRNISDFQNAGVSLFNPF